MRGWSEEFRTWKKRTRIIGGFKAGEDKETDFFPEPPPEEMQASLHLSFSPVIQILDF